jgi:hypothetical protein
VRVAFLAAALLLTVPACSSGPAGGPPVAVAGDTEQGGRISFRPVAGGAAVRVNLHCRNGTWVPLYDELRLVVGDDGRFEEHRRVELPDDEGGTIPIDVDVRGRFLDGGRAEGTVEARYRLGRTCRTGKVGWSAAQPIVEPPGPIASRGPVALLVPDGDGMLALGDDGRVRRLDLRGGATELASIADGSFVAFAESLAPDGTGGAWFPRRGGDGMSRAARHVAVDGSVRDVVMPEGLGERDIPVPRIVTDVAPPWLRASTVTRHPVWELRRLDGSQVVPLHAGGALAVAGERVWTTEAGDLVLRSATGEEVRRVEVGGPLDLRPQLRASATMACVALVPEDRLACLDVDGELTRADLPAPISGLAVDETGVWAASSIERVVRRIEGGRVVRTIDLPVPPEKLALDRAGRLWATTLRGVERIA